MPHRPRIGHLAPAFELPALRPGEETALGSRTWSLADHLGDDRAVVLIFHRHIH